MTNSSESTARPATSRSGRVALLLAVIALAASGGLWVEGLRHHDRESTRAGSLEGLERRLSGLEEGAQRDRATLDRLTRQLGGDKPASDTLAGRIGALEGLVEGLAGGDRAGFLWRVNQAEHFMRIANAQKDLAGNTTGAITALELADEHLRDAADPRVSGVRRLLAAEIRELRALPRVDVEGVTLKLTELGASLPRLPRRQEAPAQFSGEPAAPAAGTSGWQRAQQVLLNHLTSIISVRRSDAPAATLLTDEAAGILVQSLELELQLARVALLRGDSAAFRAAVDAARRAVEKYYDSSAPAGAQALAVLDELAALRMPGALPDLSRSLTELLRVKERESQP